MKVSIIIPVYNLQECIEATIVSCLNQTYKDIEIVIVNDGSTDDSEKIITKYLGDSRIVYLYQQNAGVSSSRNVGLQVSTGDYLIFLDGDDLLMEDTIEKNIALACHKNMPDWIAFPLFREDETGQPLNIEGTSLLKGISYKQVMRYTAREVFLLYENNEFPPIVCAMLFKRSFFDKSFIDGRYEDTYMFLELLAKNPIIYVSPYGGYRYINRSDSFINDKFTPEKWIYLTRAMIKQCFTGFSLIPERRKVYDYQLSKIYYNLKYLKYKNRRNPEYGLPLEYFLKEVPSVQYNFVLWTMMCLKSSIFYFFGNFLDNEKP